MKNITCNYTKVESGTSIINCAWSVLTSSRCNELEISDTNTETIELYYRHEMLLGFALHEGNLFCLETRLVDYSKLHKRGPLRRTWLATNSSGRFSYTLEIAQQLALISPVTRVESKLTFLTNWKLKIADVSIYLQRTGKLGFEISDPDITVPVSLVQCSAIVGQIGESFLNVNLPLHRKHCEKQQI